jgi:ATP-dependent DNA ligase
LSRFDLLALGREDLMSRPFEAGRALLADLLADAPPALRLTPMTDDSDVALRRLERFQSGVIDGVMAKPRAAPYRPGARAMVKVKRVCEVAYDELDDRRMRHPARFRRWRPDRDPRSCRLAQLDVANAPPGQLLG